MTLLLRAISILRLLKNLLLVLNNLLLQDKVMPQEIQSFTKKELPWDRFKVRKKLHLNRYEVRKELPWDGTGSR